jgi:methionine transaminase
MLHIQSKLPRVGTTIFSTMSALAQQHDAVNLSQGFPNFDPDARLRRLVYEYMERGANQYAPMPGLPLLRERLAEKINRDHPAAAVHPDHITVTAGGTQALFCAIGAFVRPGDEVILLEPCYDSYGPSVECMGGTVVPHALSAPDYTIDWAAVGQKITPRTRMMCLNTPCNPTGTLLTLADWDRLADLLRGTDVLVLSDEVYEHLVFDGRQHVSVLTHPELRERALAVYSFGKTFHGTGWKMGYCVAPPALTVEFRKVHQFNVFSANHPLQAAFGEYLADASVYAGLDFFSEEKRNFFKEKMAKTRLVPLACSGTYFQLFSYAHLDERGDLEFCRHLTEAYGVAAIPVSAFYSTPHDDRVVRLCFAKTEDLLAEAARRLEGL